MNNRILTLLSALLLLSLSALLFVMPVAGQTTGTATATATASGPVNSVNAYFVACNDKAIMNLSGTMLVNFDVYYQVFNAAGTALTGLRQVSVAGDFSVSDTAPYSNGATLPAAQSASAKVIVARETDSSRVDFDFTVTDVQDGCANPQFTTTTATDTGGADTTTSTSTGSGVLYGINRSILGPNGTTLNPNLQTEAQVVVGARQTDRYRSDTPGLIFAECDSFPLATPGTIYDSDSVTIFWSWYTRTLTEMQDHLAHAIYRVELNTAALPMTTRSEPVRRDGKYWVFYTATVGNLRPGHYEVGYSVNWDQAVNDGYNDYGPGTARPFTNSICNFDITPNPDGTSVTYTGMYFPTTYPVHNINHD